MTNKAKRGKDHPKTERLKTGTYKLLVARPPSIVTGYGTALISSFYLKLIWTEGFGMMGSLVEIARKLWPQDHAKSWYDRYFAC
ncbi:hypothetical protein V6N11_071701 [Hibiscus sabdariffa]|uniref:Uncharacterized protein n=2 Tax=Hibiscus sabdariffa TaxID=183260 RepID=A0ABR2U1G7_9ROSI